MSQCGRSHQLDCCSVTSERDTASASAYSSWHMVVVAARCCSVPGAALQKVVNSPFDTPVRDQTEECAV